jgi:hypothetical protein
VPSSGKRKAGRNNSTGGKKMKFTDEARIAESSESMVSKGQGSISTKGYRTRETTTSSGIPLSNVNGELSTYSSTAAPTGSGTIRSQSSGRNLNQSRTSERVYSQGISGSRERRRHRVETNSEALPNDEANEHVCDVCY